MGCGAVILWTTLENLLDNGDILAGSSGWGLWLTIGAGLLLVAAGVVAATRRLRFGRP